jgi:hypothetical protein
LGTSSKFTKKALTTLVIIGMVGVASPAHSYTLIGNRWKSSYLYVDTSAISGNTQTLVNNSLADYRAATQVTVLPSDATTSMFRVREGDWGASGWEGITNVVTSGGFITQTTSALNAWYLPAGTPNAQLQVVWTHELGHALGLNHTTLGVNHVMYSYATGAYLSGVRKLTADDINGINYLY